MKRQQKLALALVAVMAIGGLAACKHSGVSVGKGGQVVSINIDAPTTLADSAETQELRVTISNRGVNKLSSFKFDVEMPNELVVLSQTQSPGVTWTERVSAGGTKLYTYEVNNISVGSRAEVRYHVRTAFGSLDQTGDIKVTAYSDQIPGGQLIETKFIRLAN